MTISEYVKDLIKDANELIEMPYTNVREYAKYIGVSHTVVHDMINGKYDSPSPLTAVRMCRWFNIEPDDLFKMIDIKGDKELFYDNFFEKYNGINFTQKCTNILNDFIYSFDKFSEHNRIFFSFIDKAPVWSLSNLSIINTKESSIYEQQTYNATCSIKKYIVNNVEKNGTIESVEELIESDPCVIYYLPSRRIRKQSSYTYADEEIRDFVNKFMYLISSIKAPRNNLFITSSYLVFRNIIYYLRGLEITPTRNDLGIALLYHQVGGGFGTEHKIIIKNDNMIHNALCPYEVTFPEFINN